MEYSTLLMKCRITPWKAVGKILRRAVVDKWVVGVCEVGGGEDGKGEPEGGAELARTGEEDRGIVA